SNGPRTGRSCSYSLNRRSRDDARFTDHELRAATAADDFLEFEIGAVALKARRRPWAGRRHRLAMDERGAVLAGHRRAAAPAGETGASIRPGAIEIVRYAHGSRAGGFEILEQDGGGEPGAIWAVALAGG